MKYCINCGKEILDEAVVCVHCEAKQESYYEEDKKRANEILKSLSIRLKINALFWIVTGIFQGTTLILIPVAIMNISLALTDYNNSERFLRNPYGIVEKYTPLAWPIVILIFNILFGGMLGIAGSLIYFSLIRGFIMENKAYFYLLEKTR